MKETRLILTRLLWTPGSDEGVFIEVKEYIQLFPNYFRLMDDKKECGVSGRSIYVKDPIPGRVYEVSVLCEKHMFPSTMYKWDGKTVSYIE